MRVNKVLLGMLLCACVTNRAAYADGSCSLDLPGGFPADGIWYMVSGCGPCVKSGGTDGTQGEIVCRDPGEIRCLEVKVAQEGALTSVHFWNNCFTGNLGSITFEFTDEAQIVHQMIIDRQGEHSMLVEPSDAIQNLHYTYQ